MPRSQALATYCKRRMREGHARGNGASARTDICVLRATYQSPLYMYAPPPFFNLWIRPCWDNLRLWLKPKLNFFYSVYCILPWGYSMLNQRLSICSGKSIALGQYEFSTVYPNNEAWKYLPDIYQGFFPFALTTKVILVRYCEYGTIPVCHIYMCINTNITSTLSTYRGLHRYTRHAM